MLYPFKQYCFHVEITVKAPIITQAADFSRFGIDAASLLDDRGFPALPGSLIKGNLKHALCGFNGRTQWPSMGDINSWLGAESANGVEPERGCIIMPEFFSATEKGSPLRHYRIKIDEVTGRTQKGAYQVIESRFVPGDDVLFKGDIIAQFSSEEECIQAHRAIDKGLRSIGALGSFKGIGFGAVTGLIVTVEQMQPDKCVFLENDHSKLSDGLGLSLELDRSFCFSRHLKGNNETYNDPEFDDGKTGLDNEFESIDHIPGSAILASLLRMVDEAKTLTDKNSGDLQPYPVLDKYRNQIRITNALPVLVDKNSVNKKTEKPHFLPLSVVSDGYSLYDIYNKDKPGLINGEPPLFASDWKGADWALAASFSLPAATDKRLTIHTEIDRQTGASKESRLFSVISVKTDKRRWLANLDFPLSLWNEGDSNSEKHLLDKERESLIAELRELLATGLSYLGKTSAIARSEVRARFKTANTSSVKIAAGAYLRIDLLSDTLMLPVGAGNGSSTNSEATLRALYEKYWFDISKQGSLQLQNYFTSQRLVGGSYIHNRFNKGDQYNPEVLTESGSVFLLKIVDEKKASKLLLEWQHQGLPQIAGYSDHWQDNPWISQNGYGEIAVNLQVAGEVDLVWQDVSGIVDQEGLASV